MANVYFSSDLHFWHKKIQEFCPNTRRGDTVEEMNELIIQTFQEIVKPGDMLYLLGDISFSNKTNVESVISRLPGQKYLILGNHDKIIKKNVELHKYFVWVKDYKVMHIDKQMIVMSHFPFRSWEGQEKGSIHFFGHTHGGSSHKCGIIPNSIDVGLDARPIPDNGIPDMRPWEYSELVQYLKKRDNNGQY